MTLLEGTESRNIHDPIEGPDGDRLGRQALAEVIWKRLLDSSCPQSIGIYGGWGSGKTSLLNLIARINDVDSYLQLEIINAWEYENTGNLLTPVLVRLEKMALGDDFKQHITRVWKVTSIGFVELLLHKTANVGLEDIKKYIELSKAAVDEIKEAKKGFERLVRRALLVKNRKRLVFFIDNLDRCKPENVVDLLESVKNFLSVLDCVWVFAMDSGVVASFINQKYAGTTMDGYCYLDKIIEEQYHLSTPLSHETQDRMDEFVNSLFQDFNSRPNFQWKRYAHIPKVLAPRRIIKCAGTLKNYFNATIPHTARDDTIFSLTMLYHTWPDFYERLSFGEENHILGILLNFLEDIKSLSKADISRVPLDNKYTNDQELTHFLRKAYLDSSDPIKIAQELANAMYELRSVGLP